MTPEVEFEILSKKIQACFYRRSLFLLMVDTNWEGQIRGLGDAVMLPPGQPLTITKSYRIYRKKKEAIFSDVIALNKYVEKIAGTLRRQAERDILNAIENMHTGFDKVYFASAVVRGGGFEENASKYVNLSFVYGFKFE